MFQAQENVFNTSILRKDGTIKVDTNSSPNHPKTITQLIPRQYHDLMSEIRELYQISGGIPLYKPEEYGLYRSVKSLDGLVVDFNSNDPVRLYTPEGYYRVLGSHVRGDVDKFWRLLNDKFELTPVEPLIEWSESETQAHCYMSIARKDYSKEQ
jgi:hypothetical protein